MLSGSSVFLDGYAPNLSNTLCDRSLKDLKSVSQINCKTENIDISTGTGSFIITLESFPLKPYLNNIIYHNGNPPLNLFHCNSSKIDTEDAVSPKCKIEDVVAANLPSKY